jgi:purine-binding chemotaxis protein CheW
MKPLNAIFDQQASVRTAQGHDALAEERPLIRFSIGSSTYCVGIEHVLEVSELLPVVRYPEPVFGHEGIVNLRGNILPVLSFRGVPPGTGTTENRLIVLEFRAGQRFCTMVSHPKKVSLPAESAGEPVLSLDNTPAKIVTESDFPATQVMNQQEGAAA